MDSISREPAPEPAERLPYEPPRIAVIASVEAATLGSLEMVGDAVAFGASP